MPVLGINPLVDCVFKAIFGSIGNENILIHFLNAVIQPKSDNRIVSVVIQNPYIEKEFLEGKLNIVDILARGADGQIFQIEVQVRTTPYLPQRMLAIFSRLYGNQLREGQDFSHVQPVIAIWVLQSRLFPEQPGWSRQLKMQSQDGKLVLDPTSGIHILELGAFDKAEVDNELDRWAHFFKEAERFSSNELPEYLNTPEMRQAMHTMARFTEDEIAQYQYMRRVDAMMMEKTLEREDQRLRQSIEQLNEQLKAQHQEAEAQRLEAEAQRLEAEAQRQEAEAQLREQEARRLEAEARLREQETRRLEAEAQRHEAEAALGDTSKALESAEAEINRLKEQLKALQPPS